MLADCRDGKIDLILTKSISRFARNTVTLLETARELKEIGVDIFFEKENIHSTSGDGELMLTILASYAQEESRSVSENCKWRIRNDFKVGKPISVSMYGLKIDHGVITPVPEEAEVVRMIFRDYASGMGRNAILRKLDALGIPAKDGGQWHDSVIADMLRNEKYAGDLLLQKYHCPDHLTKETKRNRGELPQYLIRNNHEAIVERGLFDLVQEMIRGVGELHGTRGPKATYPFSGMITCSSCGKHYVRKTTNGKVSWQCGTYLQRGKEHCHAKQVPESTLIQETCTALNIAEFDERIFTKRVREIRIPVPNRLVYVLSDGNEVERDWKDRSRSESWNAENRKAHGERMRAIQKKKGAKKDI